MAAFQVPFLHRFLSVVIYYRHLLYIYTFTV